MANLEAAEGRWICQGRFGMLPNMSAQFALPDGFHESADFFVFARSQHLDATVAQVPHGSDDIESLRELPDGVAEANALDVAFVENLEGGDQLTGNVIRHSAGGNH